MSTSDTARAEFLDLMTTATDGALIMAGVYLGAKLGLYAALQTAPATSVELAERTGTDERLVREWLQQQTTAGLLTASRGVDGWSYGLPTELAALLLDPDDPDRVTGSVLSTVAELLQLPRLLKTFRTGRGIPYDDYGADESTGQAMSSRGLYRAQVPQWVDALPLARHLHERGGRILDVGCGHGWSTITMAEAMPSVTVDGIDLDPASIAAAEVNRVGSRAADRVSFQVRDAAQLAGAGYDLVTMFEMLHDLSRPVEALRAARAALTVDGVVLVADEPTAEEFLGRRDATEARQFGWSLLACLPMSLVEPGSAATGAVMRPSTLRRYADEAGFSSVDVLDADTKLLRLYLLRP